MSVAAPYAKALHEALKERKVTSSQAETIKEELSRFARSLEQDANFKKALTSPLTSKQEKEALVDATAKKAQVNELSARYLKVLARHNRLAYLDDILLAFDRIEVEAAGEVLAEVASAEPMSDSELADLAKSFEKKLGKKVRFRPKTDASLLAGVKVTVSGVTYDGTLRSRLNRLKDSFLTYGANG